MKILLPIDGSDAANEAVKFVQSLATSNLVDVVVLTVWYDPTHDTMQHWASEWKEYEGNRTQTVLQQAKESLAELSSTSRAKNTIAEHRLVAVRERKLFFV